MSIKNITNISIYTYFNYYKKNQILKNGYIEKYQKNNICLATLIFMIMTRKKFFHNISFIYNI